MYKIINRHVYEIASGENITLCDIVADASTDLPDADDQAIYKIAFGSFAFSIADKCFYCLDSSGTWTAADINASNFYTKSQIDTFLAAKQDVLNAVQLDTVNSGIDSTKVAQIETNKNNILSTACVGTCITAGNVAAKVVTISDNSWAPHKGSIIAVKFSYTNNATDAEGTPITLNVNNTGAYRIWYKNGAYVNAIQPKIFGYAGYYIYYMFDGVDRWLWLNYSMDNTYITMTQSEASAGTATNDRLITAKVLSDTIDEKIDPLENNISKDEAVLVDLINDGAKNKLPIPSISDITGTLSGNTTINADGTITIILSSDLTSESGINYTVNLPAGTFHYSSGENSSTDGIYDCFIQTNASGSWVTVFRDNTTNPGQIATIEAGSYRITIQFRSGATAGTYVFKPMLCFSSYWNITEEYVPYRP